MTTLYTIRNAGFSDYKSICALFADANVGHLVMRNDLYRSVPTAVKHSQYNLAVIARDVFGHEPVSLKVAEIDKQVVGVVFVESLTRSKLSWSAFEKEAYLNNLVVAEELRKQGIGTALLNAAIDWAKAKGHLHMWAKPLSNNDASLSLLKKRGFTIDSMNVGLHLE